MTINIENAVNRIHSLSKERRNRWTLFSDRGSVILVLKKAGGGGEAGREAMNENCVLFFAYSVKSLQWKY